MINWYTTIEEIKLINEIVKRSIKHFGINSKMTMMMDIQVCHLNGCKLDLQGLLDSNDKDFSHDILGIKYHIDRNNGKLYGDFTPRYAL